MNYDKLFNDNCTYQLQQRDVATFQDYLLKKQGWVYIAQSKDNSLLKIGRTSKNPWERARTLSTTGVLNDYEIIFSLPVFNQFLVEASIHQKLKKFRVSKEFFSVNKEIAISAMEKECDRETIILQRFVDTEMLKEDINLLGYALKSK